MASINLPLGNVLNENLWTGSVRVPSVFIKDHALAYIRLVRKTNNDGLRIKLSSTPDGDVNIAGPEFTDAVENYLEAFIFINQDGEELTTPGPNNGTNLESDSAEPYLWRTSNFADVSAFFVGIVNLSITIQDNIQYVSLTGELDVEIQAEGILLVEESEIVIPPAEEVRTSINLPLGIFDDSTVGWEGSVRVPSVFIKNHELAYIRFLQLVGGSLRIRLSSTPDGDPEAIGPEFSNSVENFLEAFIFINQDGEELTTPGPNNETNFFSDPDEPYFWTPPNFNEVSAFFILATNVSITIQANFQYVPLSSELDIRVNVEGILTVRELQEIQLSGEFNVQIQAQGILTVEEFVLPDQTVTQDSLVLDFNEETGLYERIGNVIVNESALRVWVPGIWIAVTLFAKLPTGDIRLWTGSPNLLLDNEEYLASRILEVSSTGSESDLNSSNRSLKVTVSAIPEIQRVVFLSPVGLAPIRLQTIVSETAGLSWRRVGQEVVGVISSPVLTGYTYTFDVEPRSALVDRARLIYWSHSDRVRRHGAVDQGMSQMPKLSDEGVLGRWPNP